MFYLTHTLLSFASESAECKTLLITNLITPTSLDFN